MKAAWEVAAEHAAPRNTPPPGTTRRTLAALLGQPLDSKQSEKPKARKEGIGRIQRIDAEKRRSTQSSNRFAFSPFRVFAILSGLDSYTSMSAERALRDAGLGSTTAPRLAAAHSPKPWVFSSFQVPRKRHDRLRGNEGSIIESAPRSQTGNY